MAESIVLFFPDAERRRAMAAQLAALGHAVRVVDDVEAATLPASAVLLTEDGDHLRSALDAWSDATPILILAGDPRRLPGHCIYTTLPIPREPSDGELRVALAAATQLLLRERRHQTLLQAAPVGIIEVDGNGDSLFCNAAWEKLSGRQLPQSVDWTEAIHPDDRAALAEEWRRSLAAAQSCSRELRLRRPDGAVVWVQVRTHALPDGARGQVVTFTDITALKEGEERLRQSDARFRELFEEAPLAYHSLDASGRLLDVNAAWTALFGYPAAEAIGRHIDEFQTEASRNEHDKEPPWYRTSSVVEGLAMEIRRKDGSVRQVELSGSIGRDAAGLFLRTHCILTDITARHEALAALRESEEKFRLLFEHAPVGIGLALPDGRILHANPAVCRMLGYSAEEMLQMNITEITHPDDIAASQKGHSDIRSGATSHFTIEKRYLHKDGHIVWAYGIGAAIHDAAGKLRYTMGIAQDISELREAERQRTEHLERQRDVLVREVHHRIKNNLQGVISLIEQLKRKQPAAADALEEAAIQVSTIAVVHGLHSRTLAAEVRPLQLVRAIVESVARLTDAAIVSMENDATPGWEWQLNPRDTVAVALVINELIYNAIKHSDAAGSVEVRYGGESGAFGVRVFNRPAQLPPGFDLAAGTGLGTGLGLILSLLPRQGARLAIRQVGDGVEAHLQLSHPCASATQAEGREETAP